jgi:AraC family transcriptional activator of pobA
MTDRNGTGDLYDPRNCDRPIRLVLLGLDGGPCEPARTNYFTVYLIVSGHGTFWADA